MVYYFGLEGLGISMALFYFHFCKHLNYETFRTFVQWTTWESSCSMELIKLNRWDKHICLLLRT